MNQTTGIGFFGILTIVFVVLKLTHVIDWSWWLVLLPFYGPAVVVFGFLAVILLFALAVAAFGGKTKFKLR